LNKRDKIIDSFKNDEDKNFAARLIDSIEQVQRNYESRFTQFLDPAQIIKAERILTQFSDVKYFVTCGLQDCERNMIVISPDNVAEEKREIPVSALCILFKSKFEKLGHRDVLGALMSIGIKRDVIGDIIMDEDKCFCLVYSDISYFIILNLDKIKHTPVKVDYIEFSKIPKKQENFKEIASSVASMRLDSILSCGYGESRSSIVQEISRGNVKVNWEDVLSSSHIINEGDIISVKGRGRIKIESVDGTTRKGRIRVVIRKII
jgi:RNA-binding protein YlmH